LFTAVDDATCAAAVDAAWDAGIRYLDTAPHYGLGLSERRLGRALAGRPRDGFTLSTKVGRLLVPSPQDAHTPDPAGFVVPATHRRVWDFSTDGVRRSLEDSLVRLGLDRVDVVYLHDPDDHWEQASREALPALTDLRDQGVVAAVGVGMVRTPLLTRFVRETDVDVVMCAGRYSLVDHTALDDLLPAAQERGVAVVLAGVYGSGLLATDRPARDAVFDYAAAPPALVARVHRIADLCEDLDVTVPQAALAFVRAHPAVVSTVLGLRDAGEVAEAVRRAEAVVPDALWPALRAAGLIPDSAPTPDRRPAAQPITPAPGRHDAPDRTTDPAPTRAGG
jgi:D-threo-aldose 1-dehydrogenase